MKYLRDQRSEGTNSITNEHLETLKDLHKEVKEKIGKQNTTITLSAGGDILEITRGNMHIRVVAGESKNRQRPFSFYRYVSTETPDKPKTEMYERKKRPVTPMDAGELKEELSKLFSKESHNTSLVEGPRVPVSADDVCQSAFGNTFYTLGDWDKLKDVCIPQAEVVIRHLGFEEGHARSKVRILEVKEEPAGSLSARMEFIEPAPLRE